MYCSVKRPLIALRLQNCFCLLASASAAWSQNTQFFYQNKCIKACCVYLSLSLSLSLSPCFYLVPLGWEAAVGSGRTCALTWSQNFNEMYECCIIGHQLFPPVIRLTNIETDCQGSFATMSENIMGFTLSPCDSHILIFLFLLKVIFPSFNSTDWQKNNNDNK